MRTDGIRYRRPGWSWLALGIVLAAAVERPGTAFAQPAEPPASAPATAAATAREWPELTAIAHAFRQVARLAGPGVVHIRVSGSEVAELPESELRDQIRRRLEEVLKDRLTDEQRRQLEEQLSQPPANEDDQRLQDLLRDFLDEGQLRQLEQQRRRAQRERPQFVPPPGTGSGIILDADGHILTNHHVIAGRSDIRVVLHDEREYPARLVGSDPKTDLAVLRINAPDLQPLRFGDSDALEVGDWVIAVGSPFGLSQTVTHGIVSAKGRTRVPGIAIDYQDFIQTDAAINPGNSGGPLLNLRGEVVGVNTAIATHGDGVNAGIAFTIPGNRAARIAEQLKTRGSIQRGWLGVSFTELDDADAAIFGLSDRHGVIVERVLSASPAEDAGMQVEDVVIRVEGVAITGSERLRGLIADLTPGDVVRLRVVRDGRERDVRVRLGLQPENLLVAARADSVEARAVPGLGLAARTLRPGLLRQFRVNYGPADRGVLVWRVDAAGPAAELAAFDLIVACDGRRVTTVGELIECAGRVDADAEIRLTVRDTEGAERVVVVKRAAK